MESPHHRGMCVDTSRSISCSEASLSGPNLVKYLKDSTMKHSRRPHGNSSTPTQAKFVEHPLALAIAAAFVALSGPAWAQLPTGAAVVNGTAGIVTSGGSMTITNSPNAILNWNSFSIGTQNSVRFQQH